MHRAVLSTRAFGLWFWICRFHADTHAYTYSNAYTYSSDAIQHRCRAHRAIHPGRQNAGVHRHLHHV